MMKGYMKKMKSKRVLALLMAALMVMTLMVPQTVSAASPTDVYTDGTKITELLTNFQYVIRNDAVLENHTVGAVAVGGKLNAATNTIGDGAQSPSYAKYILAANIGNGSGYGAATRDFYYGDSLNALPDDFTKNEGYMNLETIFGDATTGLIKESADFAVGATMYTCTENSAMGFPVIDITLGEQNMNIEIPYTELVKAKGINLNIADIDNLSKYAYTINITGVEGNSVMFEGEAWRGVAGQPSVDVFVNGKQYAFLGDMSGQVHGIECNLSGMKLIWNFPDATGNIEWSSMGGHVVAPQAGVKVTSGRFQGGIIANSFTGTGESHFYPYGAIDLDMLQSINITKKYVDADGNKVETTEQAVFGLFTDEDCTIPVRDADSNAVTATVSASTGVASFPSESLGLDRTLEYYVKEISAPEGFEINDTVYMCQFTAGGLVSYCELGKDGVPVYSLTSPVVENLKTSYATEEVGALIVTVLDKDTREVIEGVIIEVKDDNGDPVIILDSDGNIIDKTNANGVITYEDIAQGEYTVTMTIPEGYISNDEYSVEVDVLHTTYHTFELEQVKEPIIVYLKEEGTENKVTDGAWVQLQTKDENGNWVNTSSAWTGSLGQVTFKDNVAGDYRVVLGSDPAGWNLVNTQAKEEVIIVAVSDGTDVNEHTFYFDKKVGDVEVTIYEYDNMVSAPTEVIIKENGASVTLTHVDGTKETLTDSDKDGVVTFKDVPIGDVTVELTTAPNNYIKPSDSALTSDTVTVVEGDTAKGSLYAEQIETDKKGELVITTVMDPSLPSTTENATGVVVTITSPAGGDPDVITMDIVDTEIIANLTPGDYTVEITTTPDNWKTTSTVTQIVTVPEEGQGEAKYSFIQTGDIEVAVVEKDSTNNVGQAIVTVKDENGDSVVTMTTTSGSNLEIKDLPVGDYTVIVVAPNGYVESGKEIDATLENSTETTIKVTAGQTTKAEAELTRIGALTVTVVDKADPTTVVPGVVVTVTSNSTNALVGGGTTNKDGQVVVEDLPAGSYTATYTKFASGSSSAQVYDLSADEVDNTEIATITATEDGKAQLEVIKAKGDLTVIIQDEKTGAPIKGAVVEIIAPDGTKTEYTTDDDGKIELTDKDLGKYTVEVKDVPDDYNMPSQPKTNVTLDKDGEEVIKEVSKYVPGTLKVQIVDKAGNIIEETATVTVNGTEKTLTDGVVDLGQVPSDDYTVIITDIPDGYELEFTDGGNKEVTVDDGENEVVEIVLKEIKYDLTVIVKDKNTNEIVSGTTVEILDENGKTVIETTTDDNGEISVDVPKGEYTIVVKDVPDGYDNPSDDTNYVPTEVEVTEDTREFVEFIGQTVIPPVTDGTLIIKVIDQNGNKVDGTVVTIEGTNDTITDGEKKYEEVPAGDYALELKESGIPANYILNPTCDAEQTAEIIAGKTTTITYQLIQTATVDITVKDEVTGEPIPGAKVEVEIDVDNDGTPEGTITGTTNSNGEVTLDVPVKDNTTIKVTDVPEGYDEPDDKVINVNPGNNKADFVVEPIGKVTVTVYDKTANNAVVPGAGVSLMMMSGSSSSANQYVSDANGNKLILTTGANGTVTFDKLADGTYSAVVESVPADYIIAAVEGTANQATVTNGSHATALHKLYAVGNMIIGVVNKTTGQMVPNATVTVVGPTADGTDIQYITTDANGIKELPNQIIGDYTLTADAVTDCEFYGASNGNLTVEKGQTAEQKFEVVQTAGMTITVVDKVTGDPIPEADITVTDPYGNAKDYTTDDNGQVTIDKQPVGENTVVINKVPATNVLPDDRDETITTTIGGNNGVIIEAPKRPSETTDLTIKVVDEVTGAIVPGATVEIKDPSGIVIGIIETDNDGLIKLTDISIGNYSATVQTVPPGYTTPSGKPTYITVQIGGENKVTLFIKKPAASGGGTASKPAPAPSTNTTVITNITVEKAPKTGDISYMPFAVAMMVISVLGLAGITVYRKKTENER